MQEYDGFNYFRLRKEGRIAILTLNNPNKRNMLDEETWMEMQRCQDVIEAMDDLGVVVINGEGKHFSTGIDINSLYKSSSAEVMKKLPLFQTIYSRWESMAVPVIASIHGACIGNAAEMILACDLRIASKNTLISLPEVRVGGISPDFGGTTRIARLVGLGQAKRLLLTGEQIDAEEAKRIGLIEYVVEDENLFEETIKLAEIIVSQPPIGMFMAKKGLNLASESSRMAGMLFEQVQAIYCCGTEDQKESLASIKEKRKPVFKGR